MKKMIVAIGAISVGTAALPAFAQEAPKCPEGYHWDATQKKCVKHGE